MLFQNIKEPNPNRLLTSIFGILVFSVNKNEMINLSVAYHCLPPSFRT